MTSDGTIRNPAPAEGAPVEPKVKWTVIGFTVLGFVLSLIAAVLDPTNEIVTGLPDWASVVIATVVPAVGGLGAGYSARHQWRVKPGAHGGATGSTEVG